MLEEIILKLKKGQFLSVSASYSIADMDAKMKKRNNPYLGKTTRKVTYKGIRICNYENLKEVIELREKGIEPIKPTWWEWEVYPYIARHKTKGTKYLVVKPTKVIPSVTYFVDGVEANVPNEVFYKTDKGLVMFLKLDTLTGIKQCSINWKR